MTIVPEAHRPSGQQARRLPRARRGSCSATKIIMRLIAASATDAGGHCTWERLRPTVKASIVPVRATGRVALQPFRPRPAHVVQLRTIAVQQMVDESMDSDQDVHPRTPLHPIGSCTGPHFRPSQGGGKAGVWNVPGRNGTPLLLTETARMRRDRSGLRCVGGPGAAAHHARQEKRARALHRIRDTRAADAQSKNANVRVSMLSRGQASAGVLGSSKAVWAVKRAGGVGSESNTLNTSASLRSICGK